MNATLKTSLLQDARERLRLLNKDFSYTDGEIGDLIEAAAADLLRHNAIQEAQLVVTLDPLIKLAIMTFVTANYGSAFGVSAEQERLKADYNDQKAMLMMTSGYTNWEV